MAGRKFAFGEFTFESDTGTLTRRNRGWHLPEQSARLLEILLERANTLVTREELRRVLWPNEEFLDYDQGINVAVNRLRGTLRDDSRNPQFLQTIPKRGYSFRGEVTVIPMAAAASLPVEPASIIPVTQAELGASEAVPQGQLLAPAALEPPAETPAIEAIVGRPRRLAPWAWVVIVAGLIAAACCAVWVIHLRSIQPAAAGVLRLGIAPLQVQGDPEFKSIAESFQLSLTDRISRLPGVQVCADGALDPSRTSVFGIPVLSQKLKLDDLLLGSIDKQGDGYDLRFELVRTADSVHLASFEYSGVKQDLPSIRERLQHEIFYYLQSRAASVQTINGSTNDPDAYKYYLQGLSLMPPRSNPDSLRRAQSAFEQALARDPSFAAGDAGIATAWLRLSFYNPAGPDQPLPKAEDFARRAIRLDPLLAQAHAVLGFADYAQDWDYASAESELRTAIQLDPSQADYHDWLGLLFTTEGRFDEGLHMIALAHAIDPRWPSVYSMEGVLANFARRDQQAVAAGKTYLSLLPDLPLAHNTLAWIYFKAGRYKDAIGEWRQMAVLQNDTARVELEDKGMEALKTKGIRAYAQLRLDAIQSKRGTSQWNDFNPSEWYACAGRRDESIAQLERLADAHSPYVLQIAVDPLYDSFHQDPRYLALLSRLGLRVPASLSGVNSHLCESGPNPPE